jgi:hypothetical protein
MSEPISERAARHVAAFNDSVRSGDWAAAGYATQPPSDTLTVTRGVSSGDTDELWFAWDNGGTGTMILRWSYDLIAELTVTFS